MHPGYRPCMVTMIAGVQGQQQPSGGVLASLTRDMHQLAWTQGVGPKLEAEASSGDRTLEILAVCVAHVSRVGLRDAAEVLTGSLIKDGVWLPGAPRSLLHSCPSIRLSLGGCRGHGGSLRPGLRSFWICKLGELAGIRPCDWRSGSCHPVLQRRSLLCLVCTTCAQHACSERSCRLAADEQLCEYGM